MVLGKILRNAQAAPTLWQIWRSGLFDTAAYGSVNADIEGSTLSRILHYYKYGRLEDRASGQSVLAKWLLGKIIAGDVSGGVAKQAADAVGSNTGGENSLARLGLDVKEYVYLSAYDHHDFDAAFALLANLDMAFAFEQHYRFACKHMRHEHLADAYAWGINRLDEPGDVSFPFCIALQDIARVHGFELMVQPEMNARILQRLSDTKLPLFMSFQQVLWGLGFTLVDDGSTLFRDVAKLLPKSVLKRWQDEAAAPPPHAAGWETFLNAVAFNGLSDTAMSVPVTMRDNWSAPFGDVVEAPVGAKCLNARSLPARYWERSEHDASTRTYLNMFKATVVHAGSLCDVLVPTQAGDIHAIDGDRAAGLPSLGYHSFSKTNRCALHFKESALPDFYLFDREGYSGWSSWGATTARDVEAKMADVDADRIAQFQLMLKEKFVDGRISKYTQAEKSEIATDAYIFFALQIPDDTVLSLRWISTADALQALLRYAENTGVKIIVKRHPYDVSRQTDEIIQRAVSGSDNIIVSTAAVCDLIAGAKAVVTTNSGVGVEALLQLKPVITIGRSDYGAASLVAPSIPDLQVALADIDEAENSVEWRDGIKRFLYAYFHEACFTSAHYPASFCEDIEALFAVPVAT